MEEAAVNGGGHCKWTRPPETGEDPCYSVKIGTLVLAITITT